MLLVTVLLAIKGVEITTRKHSLKYCYVDIHLVIHMLAARLGITDI
jgi:hypothetical protein